MSQVIETPKFERIGDEDFLYTNTVQQDVSEIVRNNAREAEASNGFSDGRTMRKVMSLSQVDYLHALSLGYGLDAKDPKLLQSEVYRYLRERGHELGAQTVRHINTPGHTGQIIIK